MKKLFSIIDNVSEYYVYAALNILFNILSVLAALFSIALVIPFLDFLLNPSSGVVEGTGTFANLKRWFYQFLQSYINSQEQSAPGNGKLRALMIICVIAIGAMFLKNLFRYLAMYYLAVIRNGVIRDIRNKMMTKIMKLHLGYFSESRKGDIMARITNDVTEIEWCIMGVLESIFRDPVSIILTLVILISISLKLTLIVFMILPLAGLIIGLVGKSLRRSSVRARALFGQLVTIIEETLGSLKIIKSFTAENYVLKNFFGVNEKYNTTMLKVYRRTDLSSPLSELVSSIAVMIVMYIGGSMVLAGDSSLSGSDLIGYIAMFSQIIPPAKAITTSYYNIQKGIASAERIHHITGAQELIIDQQSSIGKTEFTDSIVFENVSFSYEEGNILKDINLTIAKGNTIALVGASGSGKSTLSYLIPRFYEINGGRLTIDGIDINIIRLNSLRQLIAYVSQETVLYNDTIRNNILFGLQNKTEAEVIHASTLAHAHDFISEMPEGYNTIIGDAGNKLSGGQRQRIALARAILKDAPIIILDEATSALDTQSEKIIQHSIETIMQHKTCLVIAHRLSTVQHANEIIVLDKGEIVERGTHASLIAANGFYKKLCDLQEIV